MEATKAAARSILAEGPGRPDGARIVDGPLTLSGSSELLGGTQRLGDALRLAADALDPVRGYVAVQAFLPRTSPAADDLEALQGLAEHAFGRPASFGWGPRFLHSTGQYHKGGPDEGLFLQLSAATPADRDLVIPSPSETDGATTFGRLIAAQAAADARVLQGLGRPMLRIDLGPDHLFGSARLAEGLRELAAARTEGASDEHR